MAFQLPTGSSITGTGRVAPGVTGSAYDSPADVATPTSSNVAGYGTGPTSGSTLLSPAIQTIWSKEILFQAMPVLRFEQFAVKKTELGVMPGLTVNFMRYNNLPIPNGPLVEGIRMKTYGISAQQYRITVAEQGFAVAVSELLLNASFDDVMASASRLLGRNMALYMDVSAREAITSAASVVYGKQQPTDLTTGRGIYSEGTQAANMNTSGADGLMNTAIAPFVLTPGAIKDAVLELSVKNIPRLGETYVCFIHPSQSRQIRDQPEFIEVTKYAAPGNFMLGEIGRLWDVVFIETTQVGPVSTNTAYLETYADGSPLDFREQTGMNTELAIRQGAPGVDESDATSGSGNELLTNIASELNPDPGDPEYPVNLNNDVGPGATGTPGWDARWPNSYDKNVRQSFEAIMLGDNAFGHAISLPVELRDGGVLDFGREHALAWYSIWGFGLITDSAVVKIRTN